MEIFVVDSSPTVARMIQICVKKHGAQNSHFTKVESIDALAAKLKKATRSPDVVFLDLVLVGRHPSMAEELAFKHPSTHWVLMASIGSTLPAGTSLTHGSASHLRKPIRMSEIEGILERESAIQRQAPVANTTAATTAKSRRNVEITILMVDDSALVQRMFMRIIEEHYPLATAYAASNGREALAAIEEHGNMDIILLDIHMPVMNGMEFLDALHLHLGGERMPVIVITTDGKQEEVIQAMRRGAAAYLIKPFSGEVLYGMIDSVLSKVRR